MRTDVHCLLSALLFGLATAACQSSPAPGDPEAGVVDYPHEDGALCACATPDCLPNCSDLPPCALECSSEGAVDWVDSCGNLQYSQTCDAGCAAGSDGGGAQCH